MKAYASGFRVRIIFGWLLFFMLAAPKGTAQAQPTAAGGVLDLSAWDFRSSGPVSLIGDWEFAWAAFLDPGRGDFGPSEKKTFIWGPMGWSSAGQGPDALCPFDRFGSATYRLKIILPKDLHRLGLKLPQQHSAYVLYVDGVKVAGNGTVSLSDQGYRAAWKPQFATVDVRTSVVLVTLHIANYSMNTGGYFYPIRIGEADQIAALANGLASYEIFVFGGLVVIGVYFLFFSLFRREDLAALLIALISFLYALRVITHGEIVLSQFLTDDLDILNRIRYFTLFMIPMALIVFFRRFFSLGQALYRIAELGMTFLCGWFVLLVFTTPASVYVEVLSFFLVVMMPAGFFIILMSLHAAKLKQPSAWTLLAGLAVLLGTGFFDLYTASHRLWAFGQLSPLGFLVFVMCMAWGLGKRFADSLRQEKILSRELNLLLEKQRRFSDSLEVRVLERTQELTETNKRLSLAVEEANRASRAKTDFLAMMSHEIRTPMNAIVGMSEILETTELSESQKEYLSTIRTATDNLLVIINDILDFSRLEFGRLAIEELPTSLPGLVESFSASFLPLARKKGLFFRCTVADSCPDMITVDSHRLLQVLGNLVSNSLKFTSSGGISVSISSFFEENEEPYLLFKIQDTGIGIPKEKLPVIFESFEQADRSISRKFGGTGLGLSISRSLVQLFGGRIWAESKEKEGSSFFFTIPLKTPKADVATSQSAPPLASIEAGNLSRLKVLIVEDNRVNILVAKTLVKSLGWSSRSVDSGREALEVLRQENFDLVFMDLEMPDMDGIETTKRIRDGEAGTDKGRIPIVAMTAHALPQYRDRALAEGMNGYLTKPVTKAAILQVVSTVIPLVVRKQAANLNIEAALKALDGNLHFLRNLYHVFSEDITQLLGHYREALGAKNFDDLAKLFRTVRGSARLLDETEVEALTAELEAAAMDKDITACEQYFPALESRLLVLREEMELFLASDKSREGVAEA